MLRVADWHVNHKRVERISRQEELKFPKKQPKRARLWLNDGSCIRLRPTYRNHVWSYDFVVDRTHDGRPVKILTVLDEYSRLCLALVVGRRIKSDDLLHHLSNLFLLCGVPKNIRSDNGPEFTAKAVRQWLGRIGVKVLIEAWRKEYNDVRPHSSLGYRPSAPEVLRPLSFEPFWLESTLKNMPRFKLKKWY